MSFELILLKMSVKKLVIQLEKHINLKFPEYHAKFYLNRGKSGIGRGRFIKKVKDSAYAETW